MADVPAGVRREVIRRIYEEMDRMRWDEMTNRDKSVAYERFVSDPAIGGRLAPYLGSDKIRVWIKDGPAKEYGRALEGVGSYAIYTRRMYPSARDFVIDLLGPEWSVREESVGDKPMRCWADTQAGDSQAGDSQYVIWGPRTALKDLVWQAVIHRVEHWDSEPLIIITTRGMSHLPEPARAEIESTCRIVGAEMREARRAVVDKPRGS